MRDSKHSSIHPPRLMLPSGGSPLRVIGMRLMIVLTLIGVVVLTFWLDRENLRDASDGHISFVDVVYFTMVTVTTVGYGDIVPVGDRARLLDAIFVTPIRLFIWLLFLGTAYQFVLQRIFGQWQARRHGARMKAHVIVVGFGYEGRMAVRETIERGHPAAEIVVIDEKDDRLEEAQKYGCTTLNGDATKNEIMQLARVDTARAILVCLPRDDTAALCILTVRNLGSTARLIASAREQENIQLLRQAGADEVVAPAKLGGYLMADAITAPMGLRFVTDLLTMRGVLNMIERPAASNEVGLCMRDVPGHLVVALQRGGKTIGFWSEPGTIIEQGDRLFAIHGRGSEVNPLNGKITNKNN